MFWTIYNALVKQKSTATSTITKAERLKRTAHKKAVKKEKIWRRKHA